jgi:hypothetical protein
MIDTNSTLMFEKLTNPTRALWKKENNIFFSLLAGVLFDPYLSLKSIRQTQGKSRERKCWFISNCYLNHTWKLQLLSHSRRPLPKALPILPAYPPFQRPCLSSLMPLENGPQVLLSWTSSFSHCISGSCILLWLHILLNWPVCLLHSFSKFIFA